MKRILWLTLSVVCLACANRQGYTNSNKKEIIEDGYSSNDGDNYTGAASSLKGFEQGIPLEDYLKRIVGVSVVGSGSSAVIRIRGIANSINADSEPLFVINNSAINGGFSTVSSMIVTTDIKSITVLKDAASTGIYGTRASNGVIVIKLKS